MAYKITEECIACGACIPECPEEAITEADPIYIIDPEKCDDCGSCADVCPVDCCILDPDNRETEEVLLARARAIHDGGSELEFDERASHFRAA